MSSSLQESSLSSTLSSQIVASSTRTESAAIQSDGCVSCEGTVKCPICADDEYCVMTSLTCKSCPYTYCTTRTNTTISGLLNNSTLDNNSNNNSTKNGTSIYGSIHHSSKNTIIGSVVGSITGVIFIIAIIWYSLYLRRKNMLAKVSSRSGKTYNANDIELDDLDREGDIDDSDNSDDDDDDLDDLDDDDLYDIEEEEEEEERSGTNISPIVMGSGSNATGNNTKINFGINNDKLATTSQYVNELRNMTQQQQQQRGFYTGSNTNIGTNRLNTSITGDRNSMASTIRTGYSNVLPIGYIPGVTSSTNINTMSSNKSHSQNGSRRIRPNHHLNIPGDIRSHITIGSSILEGMYEDEYTEDNVDNESGNRMNIPIIDRSTKPIDSMTTTAIKGRPKLVQINEEVKADNNDDNDNNLKRDSMMSNSTGTGSYILDFNMGIPTSTDNIMRTPMKPHPPIPARTRMSSTNGLPHAIDKRISSLQSHHPHNNNNEEDTSTMTSDMITIDTKEIENILASSPTPPYSQPDSHVIIAGTSTNYHDDDDDLDTFSIRFDNNNINTSNKETNDNPFGDNHEIKEDKGQDNTN